jgi:small subunit ribosomal protein S8
MQTRIRNAGSAKHETVDIPSSKVKASIADILLEEGYIREVVKIDDGRQGILRITLKYTPTKKHVISGIKRISKPGLRVYAKKDELPRVLGGLGIAIVSTSKGIMTDKKARKLGVGGEVLAYVW